jgi:hypothetical protein
MSECRVVGSGISRPRGVHALRLAEAQNLQSSETMVSLEGVGHQLFIYVQEIWKGDERLDIVCFSYSLRRHRKGARLQQLSNKYSRFDICRTF